MRKGKEISREDTLWDVWERRGGGTERDKGRTEMGEHGRGTGKRRLNFYEGFFK